MVSGLLRELCVRALCSLWLTRGFLALDELNPDALCEVVIHLVVAQRLLELAVLRVACGNPMDRPYRRFVSLERVRELINNDL